MMVPSRQRSLSFRLSSVALLLLLALLMLRPHADATEIKGGTDNNTTGVVITPKIVGGQVVGPRSFRWFVVSTQGFLCGGTLIHDDIVLTAAHCKDAFLPGYTIMIGTTRRGSGKESDTQYRKVVRAVQHPWYSSFSYRYDFMVLKLDNPVFNFEPIRLNRNRFFPNNNALTTVIGFGRTSEGGSVSNELRSVNVQILEHGECQKQYSNSIVDEVMVCAMVGGGGRDSCQGDSGGPQFIWSNGEYIQVGVVSFGSGCARPTHAGVYSRVSAAIDWIEPEICNLSVLRPASCFPTPQPTQRPTPSPTNPQTNRPTPQPSNRPTPNPTDRPTPQPSNRPTPQPSNRPTPFPTSPPTTVPSLSPTTLQPTIAPSTSPTVAETSADIRLVMKYGKSNQVRYWEIRKLNGNGAAGPRMFTGPAASKVPLSAETIMLYDVPFGAYLISVFDSSLDGSTDSFRIFQKVRGGPDLCLFRAGGNFYYREDIQFVVSKGGVASGSCATQSPTTSPTELPTSNPSVSPSAGPTTLPTRQPTEQPTEAATNSPTGTPPTYSPSKAPTPAPSASPTVSPTPIPTVFEPTQAPRPIPGHALLKITVRYDDFPLDTRWSIQQGYNDVLTGPQTSFVPAAYDEEVRWWFAPYGDYSFRIIDKMFNGVSRSDFFSIIQVLDDGNEEEIAFSNKPFAFYGFKKDFTVHSITPQPSVSVAPSPLPSLAPTNPPSPTPTTTLKIVIDFVGDQSKPREWILVSMDDGKTVDRETNYIPSANSATFFQYGITLGTYKLTIYDSNLQGSQDFVHLYQILEDGTQAIVTEGPDGGFWGSEDITFHIDSLEGPSSTTANPTNAPTYSPTLAPSSSPAATQPPTADPTEVPTSSPTEPPTEKPTPTPSSSPTSPPTESPNFGPTSAPTSSPTFSPTTSSPTLDPETSSTIKLVIRYDERPGDTRWSIRQGYTDLFSGPPPGTVPEAYSEEVHVWTVRHGDFQVRVTDKAFDGVSRNDFFSLYQIRDDLTDVPLLQSSTFFTSGSVGFQSYGFAKSFSVRPILSYGLGPTPTLAPTSNPAGQPSSSPMLKPTEQPSSSPTIQPTSAPSSSPLPTTARIRLTVKYDGNPHHIRWTIKKDDDPSDASPFAEGPEETPQPFETRTTEWDDFPFGSYSMTIFDNAWDGIDHDEYFTIVQIMTDDTEEVLATGNRKFYLSSTVSFDVAASGTSRDFIRQRKNLRS